MDEKILRNLIEVENKSYNEISILLGIPKSTVAWNVKKYGIIPAKKNKVLDKDRLIEFYEKKLLSAKEVGKKLGASNQSVYFWLNFYGIKIRPVGTNQFEKITFSMVKSEFKKHGHTLLETKYENANKKLKCLCRCGQENKISYTVCKRGGGCIKCSAKKRRKYPIELKKHTRDYQKYPEFRKKCSIIQRERYPEKYLARQFLKRALETGKILRPKACECCLIEAKRIEGHHEDYAKPLEVIWLCVKCHKNLHMKEVKGGSKKL